MTNLNPLRRRAAEAPQNNADDDLVSSFVTDTIMILAIALIVYIPAARNQLGAQQQRQAPNAPGQGDSRPVEVDVIQGSILVTDNGVRVPAPTLSAEERGRLRGRSSIVRVHGDAISSQEMAELSHLYHDAELASWSFEFTSREEMP